MLLGPAQVLPGVSLDAEQVALAQVEAGLDPLRPRCLAGRTRGLQVTGEALLDGAREVRSRLLRAGDGEVVASLRPPGRLPLARDLGERQLEVAHSPLPVLGEVALGALLVEEGERGSQIGLI